MVQNKEILYSFYRESECWIFWKMRDSKLVWIYTEAGCHALNGNKKGSLSEPKKCKHVIIWKKRKKNISSKYIKSIQYLTKSNQIFNKRSWKCSGGMRSSLPETKLKSSFNYQNDACSETSLFLKILYQSKCEGKK